MWADGNSETSITNQQSLLLLKPDAIERQLQTSIADLCAVAGLRICSRRSLVLDHDWLLRLDAEEGFRSRQVTFAFKVAYLTEGPVEAWLVEGSEITGTLLWVKSLARLMFGDVDTANVLHTPDNEAEADHQLRALFSEELHTPTSRDVTTPELSPVIADRISAIVQLLRAPCLAASAVGDAHQCGVVIRDDNWHDADHVFSAFLGEVPGADEKVVVAWIRALKVFGRVEVYSGSLAEAAQVAYALDDRGLFADLRPPDWMTALQPGNNLDVR